MPTARAAEAIAPGPGKSPARVGRSVETHHGGLFCLLNAAIALGLYGDFTTPDAAGIALSPWDFLAIAGERLDGPAIRRDPVWPLLADLAGRDPAHPPGEGFAPAPDWRLPPEWLAPFAGARGTWSWSIAAGRLQVRHPAGFLAIDMALDLPYAGAEGLLADEMQPYRAASRVRLAPTPAPLAPPCASPFARWVDGLMPYLAQRIARAMGRRAIRAPARQLIHRAARIDVGAARIDIHLRLADLPIAVRLAGLDRDPGWVPAAGRFVAFHYD